MVRYVAVALVYSSGARVLVVSRVVRVIDMVVHAGRFLVSEDDPQSIQMFYVRRGIRKLLDRTRSHR
jgi:hypothetical protein